VAFAVQGDKIATELVGKIAGELQSAALDGKVQVVRCLADQEITYGAADQVWAHPAFFRQVKHLLDQGIAR
jgi:hypothetical protein